MVYFNTVNEKRKFIIGYKKIWRSVGMNVSTMTIDEHDKIMSITSHLPHLIALQLSAQHLELI